MQKDPPLEAWVDPLGVVLRQTEFRACNLLLHLQQKVVLLTQQPSQQPFQACASAQAG